MFNPFRPLSEILAFRDSGQREELEEEPSARPIHNSMQKLRRRFSNPVNNLPEDLARGRSNSSSSYFEEFFGRHSTGTSLPTGPRRPASVRPSEPLLSTIFASANGKSRRNLEIEQRALYDQISALQSTMRGLADMLRDQDQQLATSTTHNTKLTEELNRLADENVELRRQIQEQRRLKNAAWEELQIYKMAARTRRDKLIVQQRAISQLAKQKDDLARFSQDLLEQLTNERKKQKQRRHTLKTFVEDDRRFSTISVDFDDLEQETNDMMVQFHETLASAPVELSSDLKPEQDCSAPTKTSPTKTTNNTSNSTYLDRPNIDEEMESPRRSRKTESNQSVPSKPRAFFPKESSPEPSAALVAAHKQSQSQATSKPPAKSNHLNPPAITEEDFLSSSDDDDEFAFFDASPSTPIAVLLSSIESKFQGPTQKEEKTPNGTTPGEGEYKYELKGLKVHPADPEKVKTIQMDSPSPDDTFDPKLDIMAPYENPFDSLKSSTPSGSPEKKQKFFESEQEPMVEPDTLEIDEDMLFMEESFDEDEPPDLIRKRSTSKSQSKSTQTSRLPAKKRRSLSHSYSHSQSHSAVDDLWSSGDDSD